MYYRPPPNDEVLDEKGNLRFPGFRTWPLILGLIAIVLLGALLWPITISEPMASPKTRCLSNMAQLGKASELYEDDYDGFLPPARWSSAFEPYIKARGPLTDPLLEEKGQKYGYAFNKRDVRRKIGTIHHPQREPLFFDSSVRRVDAVTTLAGLEYPPRHDGANNFAFADGHARSYTPDQLARMLQGD